MLKQYFLLHLISMKIFVRYLRSRSVFWSHDNKGKKYSRLTSKQKSAFISSFLSDTQIVANMELNCIKSSFYIPILSTLIELKLCYFFIPDWHMRSSKPSLSCFKTEFPHLSSSLKFNTWVHHLSSSLEFITTIHHYNSYHHSRVIFAKYL